VLKIKITGGDVPAFGSGRDSLMLTLRRYCAPSLTALAGAYTNTNEYTSAGAFSYGPYTTTVSNLAMVAGSTTSATGKISNLYDDGWNDLNFTIDWLIRLTSSLQWRFRRRAKLIPGDLPM
jgi:hypothetical protein